jgi:hypothetical protein
MEILKSSHLSACHILAAVIASRKNGAKYHPTDFLRNICPVSMKNIIKIWSSLDEIDYKNQYR